MSALALSAQWLIVFVFAFSVVGKASGLRRFRAGLPALLGVSQRTAVPLAFLVVAGECAIAVSTAIPASRGAGLLAAAVLLIAFCAVIVRVQRNASGAACSCFGGSIVPLSPRHLARNGVLLAAACVGLAAGDANSDSGRALAWSMVAGLVLAVPIALLDEFSYALGWGE